MLISDILSSRLSWRVDSAWRSIVFTWLGVARDGARPFYPGQLSPRKRGLTKNLKTDVQSEQNYPPTFEGIFVTTLSLNQYILLKNFT